VAASVVVLGAGAPAVADLLASPVAASATDATELQEVLDRIPGDVVLLDPGLDCSGAYPVQDVCAPLGSRVLVGQGGTAPIRIAGGVLVGAGTADAPLREATDLAAGCLQVAAADRPALDRAMAHLRDGPPGPLWQQLLSLLVMQAVAIRPVVAAPFRIGPGVGRDPDPVVLQARRCARGGDGWLSERTVRRLSRLLTPWAVRARLTPTTVTVLSLLVGAGAVAAALVGTRAAYLVTAVLMVVSLVLDCVDGEVARWTHRYSRGGAWLDAVGDRVKEYAVWFAVGWAAGQQRVWTGILACLVLFTTKHFLDYGWSLRQPPWQAQPVAISADPDPWAAAGTVPARVRPPSWRRVLGLPIAERWLLLAVLLPLAGPWWTFLVLAALGALSLAYTVLTRVRWSHQPISGRTAPQLRAITDPGPLLLALRPQRVALAAAALPAWLIAVAGARSWFTPVAYLLALGLFALAYGRDPRGRLGWMTPAVARFTEMTVLVAVAWPVAGPAVYALLAAAAWRHYDVIYRIRHQHTLPDRPAWVLLLGTEGRVIAATALAVLGVGTWYWLALYLAVVAVGDSLFSWFGRR
jgi:phosphatidylglycerophosphate synthase